MLQSRNINTDLGSKIVLFLQPAVRQVDGAVHIVKILKLGFSRSFDLPGPVVQASCFLGFVAIQGGQKVDPAGIGLPKKDADRIIIFAVIMAGTPGEDQHRYH